MKKLTLFFFLLLFSVSINAWYDESYLYRGQILNASPYSIEIAINGSKGGFGNILWVNTNMTPTPYFYFSNSTRYLVANSSTRLPLEDENGTAHYQPSSVYISDALAVFHLHNLSDSTPNAYQATLTGTPTKVDGCTYADCYDFDSATDQGLYLTSMPDLDTFTQYTVVSIFNTESYAETEPTIWITTEDAGFGLQELFFDTSDKLTLGSGNGAAIITAKTASALNLGQWYCAVLPRKISQISSSPLRWGSFPFSFARPL